MQLRQLDAVSYGDKQVEQLEVESQFPMQVHIPFPNGTVGSEIPPFRQVLVQFKPVNPDRHCEQSVPDQFPVQVHVPELLDVPLPLHVFMIGEIVYYRVDTIFYTTK